MQLLNRLSQIQVGVSGNLGRDFNRSYTYDSVGNVKTMSDLQSAGTQSYAFGYDFLNRLTSATASARGSDSGYNETYGYDQIGNLTAKAGTAYSYKTGGSTRPHAVSSVGAQAYTYDANGNLLSGGGRSLTWNVENMPTGIIPAGGTVFAGESYTYDAQSARVSRTQSGTTTFYLGGVWEEEVGSTNLRRIQYSFGGKVVAQRDSAGSLIYLHSDHLGSSSLATGGSGGGAVLSRQEFDPWGKVRSSTGITQTTLNYTGQKLDGTGLLYYHARMYDPSLGTFISADTIVPSIELPQGLNRFSYAVNNPLTCNDPDGHDPWAREEPIKRVLNVAPLTQLTKRLARIDYYTNRKGTDANPVDVDRSYAANGCTYIAEAIIADYFDHEHSSYSPVDHDKNSAINSKHYKGSLLSNNTGGEDRNKLFNGIAGVIDNKGLVELGFAFTNTNQGKKGEYHYNDGEFKFDWVRHTVVAVGYIQDPKTGAITDIIIQDPADRSGKTSLLSKYLNYKDKDGSKFGKFDMARVYK